MPVYVLVAEHDGEVRATVTEAENLKQLHAEFRGVDDAAAGAALTAAGLGTVDGDHAWLDAAALRRCRHHRGRTTDLPADRL